MLALVAVVRLSRVSLKGQWGEKEETEGQFIATHISPTRFMFTPG